MKILITGKNGYIGKSMEKFLLEIGYDVECVSIKEGVPRNISKYDTIIHCAALVHKNEKKYKLEDYMKINYELTMEIAEKCKESCKQFVFLSSMSVYGKKMGIIDSGTKEMPATLYGKSKLKAEEGLKKYSDKFRLAIIRPPMVYGENCVGNYVRLSKVAKLFPIFPKVANERSMIYIENLCELIRLIIENQSEGIFTPQNAEYICTSKMVKEIRRVNGKNIHLSPILGWILGKSRIGIVEKVFGNLIYDKNISKYFENQYNITSFKESIKISESKK